MHCFAKNRLTNLKIKRLNFFIDLWLDENFLSNDTIFLQFPNGASWSSSRETEERHVQENIAFHQQDFNSHDDF
jgi:hypothetical protein